jgi:hypothetical protein
MMSEPSPWDDIGVPGSDFQVRQIAGNMAVPCFWGRDTHGACLLIIELSGDHSVQYRKDATTVHGIDVELRDSQAGAQRLVLTLHREVDRDLFAGLCRTLLAALEHATDPSSSLTVALAHIRRWKAFWAGGAFQHLSPEEVRGLFAELIFLLELIERPSSISEAVAAWLGPERSHQDFIFGNTAVEIKSLSGTERSSVKISSEDQLESLNDQLFLRIYRLSSLAEAIGARSLNGLVDQVRDRLSEAEAIDEFERKLAIHRYAPLPLYDDPKFVVSETRSFRVRGDFPRLVRSLLPVGITKTSYDIKLEAIAAYECDGECVYGGD